MKKILVIAVLACVEVHCHPQQGQIIADAVQTEDSFSISKKKQMQHRPDLRYEEQTVFFSRCEL